MDLDLTNIDPENRPFSFSQSDGIADSAVAPINTEWLENVGAGFQSGGLQDGHGMGRVGVTF